MYNLLINSRYHQIILIKPFITSMFNKIILIYGYRIEYLLGGTFKVALIS